MDQAAERDHLQTSQPAVAPVPRVDAHHHLWRYTPQEFDWLGGDLTPLRHDFLEEDLLSAARSAAVAGTVAVQARQTIAETDWLLEIAKTSSVIRGVVGWLPIADANLATLLERYAGNPLLRGLRHIVQGEPDGFLLAPEFNRGVDALAATNLVYDILIYERQMEEAIRFIDLHPGQPFVLDHLAKPRIAAGHIASWGRNLHEIAKRPNVSCKLSGMVTEADPHTWSPSQLEPYFQAALEAFTPHRLMIGTDWPVLTVGCTYARWWQTVEAWIAPLSPGEQGEILGGTATRVYNLDLP